MHYLGATASVHTTAAICDYLDERATSDATARRDAAEALNVAPVRLAGVGDVRTERYEGDDPVAALGETAATVDADEIVVAPAAAESQRGVGIGGTASAPDDLSVEDIVAATSLPVVAVPVDDF